MARQLMQVVRSWRRRPLFALTVVVILAVGLGSSGLGRIDSRQPAMTALLVGEVALATVLMVAAGLLLTSFRTLGAVEPGFESERLAFAGVGLPPAVDTDGSLQASRRRQLLDKASSVTGVLRAALASDSPLEGG